MPVRDRLLHFWPAGLRPAGFRPAGLSRSARRRIVTMSLIAPLAGVLVATSTGTASMAAGLTDQITVAPAQSLATVPGTAIGINASTYDGSLLDSQVPGLLHGAGISLVRLPGGLLPAGLPDGGEQPQ